MPTDAAGMLFFFDEYQYLKSQDKVQEGFEEKHNILSFEISPKRIIRIITSYCHLEGRCTYPEYRPLICKVYPYFPRISLDTLEITGYAYSSALDQYWGALSLKHPCHIVQTLDEKKIFKHLEVFKPLLSNPYFIFYFKAIEIVLDNLKAHLQKTQSQIFNLPPADFFSRWEFLYVTGKAFNKKEILSKLEWLDNEVQRRFGYFEL